MSIAVSTGSPSAPASGEAELVRAAARRDGGATAELIAAHGPVAWRLAQAVVPDPEASAAAVGDGFARVLRAAQRRRGADPFRFAVLAGTYRSALEAARAPGQAERDAAAVAALPVAGDAAAASAAFRSLPERWRAALWLHEVEGMPPVVVAASLDVSEAVAHQLVSRGRKALVGRHPAAAAPGALADSLRPLAAPTPPALAPVVTERIRTGLAADIGGLLGERATRPLATAAAGVIAVGVIGVGVLGSHVGSTDGPALRSASAPAGSAPGVATGAAALLNPISAVGSLSPYGDLYPTLVGTGGSTLYGGLTGAVGSPSGGLYQLVGGVAGAPAGPGATSPSPGGGSATGGGSAPGGGPGGSTAGGTPTPPPVGAPGGAQPPATSAPLVPVTLPPVTLPAVPPTVATPVITVTNGGGSVGVTTPLGGGSVGTCTALNVLGQPVDVACPTTTSTVAPPPAPAPTTTTVPLLGGILGGL